MNSKEWWEETKRHPSKLAHWLVKQEAGERRAAREVHQFAENHATPPVWVPVLRKIASQEFQHAEWLASLLFTRAVEPWMHDTEQRYWKEVEVDLDNFDQTVAQAAHAEEMRLERIREIAQDIDPAIADVSAVFRKILKDEEFHAKAFRAMATEAMYASTAEAHSKGMGALGLTI